MDTPTPEDGGHRTKRLKLTQPKAQNTGMARFRTSAEGLVEEPVGSRGPPKKSGSLSAGRGKLLRASTGNMANSTDHIVSGMVGEVFTPLKDKFPTTPTLHTNGVATPPPSTDTPHEPSGVTDSGRRQVSGPGQFTPRALLKDEDQFVDVGIDAGLLLRMRGDYISWWMAEAVLKVARYLEHPQEGTPKTLDARPGTLPLTREGKAPQHCCSQGGITHLLPCNFSKPPAAKEAFGFADQKRDILVSEHHASKGGINTIAFVGDLVLDKFVGESKIDEDEFRLLAGSEHLRQWLRRGEKRYKAPDPHVDPTKQPILLLKSFKKMAMNEDFVEQLKRKYAWALSQHSHLIGPREPEPVTSPEPSPVPAFAQRAAASAPALNLAPAPTPGSVGASAKKARKDNGTPIKAREGNLKRSFDSYRTPADPENDARISRKPQFPLRDLSEQECTRLTKAIYKMEELIEDIHEPMKAIQKMAAAPAKAVSKVASPRKSTRGRKKSSRASDQISILLDAAATTNTGYDEANSSASATTRLSEPVQGDLSLPVSANFDGYIRTLIEIVVNGMVCNYPDDVSCNPMVKELVNDRFRQLSLLVNDLDLRLNTAVTTVCGRAISDLYSFLLPNIPKPVQRRRTAPGSPTGQLMVRTEMELD